MDNAAKIRAAIAGVVVLILIGVVAGVVNHVQRDDELPPIHRPTPILTTTPLVPLLDCIDGYIFNIDGGIRVCVSVCVCVCVKTSMYISDAVVVVYDAIWSNGTSLL